MSNFQQKSISKVLKVKLNDFQSNRQDTAAVQAIIQSFEEHLLKNLPITSHLLCLETLFIELLKSGDMDIPIEPMKMQENSHENNLKMWYRQQYNNVFEKVVGCFACEKSSDNQQAFNTAMKLLTAEGKFSSEDTTFPIRHLNAILFSLLSPVKPMKILITKLSEYADYQDFIHFCWKILFNNLTPIKLHNPTKIFIENYLELLNVIIVKRPSELEPKSQCQEVDDDQSQSKFLCKPIKLEDPINKKLMNKIWNYIILWNHNEVTHRQLLVLLLEKFLVHLEKPILLTDFLMNSLDCGGSISLLAFQGIFILIHKFNMSYPNIYEKLYAMFEPEVFHMKFKPRLFYLADIFLNSTYLPESLIAAFIKRLARLSLLAPPQDIVIILYFISNLIIRNPGLKRLIYNSECGGNEVVNDPFIMDECDPYKSNANQSSLWELHTLKQHVLPNIATIAKTIISQPMPSMEWDLSNFLELNENDLFDHELKTKAKEFSMNFEKPLAFQHQQNNKMSKYFKLF